MMLYYEIGCLIQRTTCNGPRSVERSEHGNIPDWEACSILCFSKEDCLSWHYYVKGRLCKLYNNCQPLDSNNEDDLIGNRNCHATRK